MSRALVGGLTQTITPPDFETRIAILQSKTEHLGYNFQSDTLEYLAGQFDSNVRDLEGSHQRHHFNCQSKENQGYHY